MKQIKSILLGISLFLLHSCNLLDVDTVSSITGDGYWNTKGDVESYLIGAESDFTKRIWLVKLLFGNSAL